MKAEHAGTEEIRNVTCDILDEDTEGMVRTSGTYALGQATIMCIGECIANRLVEARSPARKGGVVH